MAYKLMIIDDDATRNKQYVKVFSDSEFDPLYIWTRRDFERYRNRPVDGYVIDVFLSKGDWADTNAAELLKDIVKTAPRSAPCFFVSQRWGDDKVLNILKQVGESSAKVVQYLAWSEFQQATEHDNSAAKDRMNALRCKLLFELDHWHGQSGFRPSPDDTIRVLLLADVQFGDPAVDPRATFAEHWIANVLRAKHELPDLIVVAGDISHSGTPAQFVLAEDRFVNDLMGTLWGYNNIDRMRDRIVLVPGNHDVNLRFSACDMYKFNLINKKLEKETIEPVKAVTDPRLLHHTYAFDPFRRFASQLTKDRNWDESSMLSWVDRRFLHCGIRFFVMNSVGELSASKPDNASFSECAVRNINRSLADDESNSLFSIVVSHHGLRPEGTASTEKELDDWISVSRDLFSMHHISLWLYGHYHIFNARSINSKPFNKKPLWLVQTPSLRIGSATRGFCVLELNRRAGRVIDAKVHHFELGDSTSEKKGTTKVFGKG